MSATDPTPSPLSDDALRKWRETAENQPIRTSYVTYYDAPKRIVALVDDLLSARASLAAAEKERDELKRDLGLQREHWNDAENVADELRDRLVLERDRSNTAIRERDEARADLEVAFCGEDAATYELHIEKLRRLEAERDAAQRSAADARAALEKMLAATDHAIGQSVLDAIMAGGLLRTECPTCKHHGLLHIWSGNAQEQLGAAAKSALDAAQRGQGQGGK